MDIRKQIINIYYKLETICLIEKLTGGGENYAYTQKGETYTLLSMSTNFKTRYKNNSGDLFFGNASVGEVFAHEVLGHGVGALVGFSGHLHSDAIHKCQICF